MEAKFLGYDVRIIYNERNYNEVLVQDLDEIENICKNIENKDDTYEVEYKKKYELEDKNFVYSKKEHISIDNQNIPKREILIRKFYTIARTIFISLDVKDENLRECYDILGKILSNDDVKK